MVDFEYKDKYNVYDLVKLVKVLRAPGGCPWDIEQTHESIRRDFLEETYEAIEAINEKSVEHLREELGDVLLQVIFHADIEEDAGHFNIDDVADENVKKLILRHPHVFGDVRADTPDEVLSNWDDIKREEKHQETVTDAMNAVAKSLPATWRAEKVQKKAAKVGFDWKNASEALEKVSEEKSELEEAIKNGGDIGGELGDLLFSVINAARLLKLDPEEMLNRATDKFIARFSRVESEVLEKGLDMREMDIGELDRLWDSAKERE